MSDRKISYQEFVNRVTAAMKDYVGKGFQVMSQKVQKNNGCSLVGISVFGKNRMISPTIYMEEFYQEYQSGATFGEIMYEIVQCYETHTCRTNIDMSFYMDYEKVKKKIAFKLINREKNRELLKEVPCIPYLNLAIVFFCMVDHEEIGSGTILIKNSHLKMWDVQQETVFRDAICNTPLCYPEKICEMSELLTELTGALDSDLSEELYEKCDIPVYVISNEQKLFGASVLLYDGVLKRLAQKTGSHLAILPSSIHEMIAVPVSCEAEAARMEAMVREINETQVACEDVLSDQVYFYDREKGKLIIAGSRKAGRTDLSSVVKQS